MEGVKREGEGVKRDVGVMNIGVEGVKREVEGVKRER